KNQYLGVNAHLMSILQTPRRDRKASWWLSFQMHYVVYIMEQLNNQLPAGYVAVNQPSLQVFSEDSPNEIPDDTPESVVIFDRQSGHDGFWGRPITRIEVLYAPQDQGLSNYSYYNEKRRSLLSSEIALVEVDFLHEIPSPSERLPSYPNEPH